VRYSPAEPVTEVRRIRIVECGEPLVPYLGVHPRVIEGASRWNYRRVHFLRQGVAERLFRAADALPKGFALAVVEGWRPPYIQERMYRTSWLRWKERRPEWSDAQLRRVVNRFTAPLHGKVPPPHSTGGAFDLVLATTEGLELDHSSPFERSDPHSYLTAVRGLTEEAARNRRTLIEALESAGLTNYPSEWWHWSWGDQGWAYRTGAEHAVYGPVTPDGWAGHAADMTDEPLTRIG
jgi:zinc D-Ala-D-Ala dipeptidase